MERRLAAGNVLDQRFTWDHHNRLSQVETFSAGSLVETIAYRYNATGGLVRRSVTPAGGAAVVESYVLAEGQRAMTLNSAGAPTHRYQYGPTGEVIYDQVFNSVGQTTDLREPLGDHQHSTRVVLGHAASGAGATAVRQTVDYAPFGEVTAVHDANGLSTTAALDVAFAHHGSLQDADTGLQLKGARWYSPDLGRFLSVDPAHDGTNWYAFAGNDPVNMSDPTGLSQAGHPLGRSTLAGPSIGGASILAGLGAGRSADFGSPSTRINVAPSPLLTHALNSPGPSSSLLRELEPLARAAQTSAQQQRFASVTAAFQAAGRQAERDATARAAIGARSQSQQQSVIWSGLGGLLRGLGVGVKSLANSVASTAVSAATLGFKSYAGPLAVTQYDRDVGYDAANGLHRVGGEIFAAVGTGGLSLLSRAGTATRLVAKSALAYDAAGNVLAAGRGAADAYQNGLGGGNFVQIVGGSLGFGGNAAAGGRALSELASDAGRIRVEKFGFNSGVPVPKRVYLAPGKLQAGQAGSFSDLDARAIVGDNLTPHHMPQAALGFTGRSEGGAIMLPQFQHIQTRTYGYRGAQLAASEAGTPFRTVLARDIRDLRGIAGSTYNSGIQDVISYYRQQFPEIITRP